MSYQPNNPDYPPAPPPSGDYPPAPGGGYVAPPPAPAPPAKKGPSVVKIVLYVIVALVVVVGGIVAYVNSRSKPASTAVGDCLTGQTAETLKKVGCTDTKAEWKVVGRVGDKTEAETTVEDTCKTWPTADTVYWEGERGKKGFALCLEPVKK